MRILFFLLLFVAFASANTQAQSNSYEHARTLIDNLTQTHNLDKNQILNIKKSISAVVEKANNNPNASEAQKKAWAAELNNAIAASLDNKQRQAFVKSKAKKTDATVQAIVDNAVPK